MDGKSLKPGDLVAFASGAYSDYIVDAVCRVLKPITAEVWREMIAACTRPRPHFAPLYRGSEAMPWFERNGYVQSLEYHELHVGGYGGPPDFHPEEHGALEKP